MSDIGKPCYKHNVGLPCYKKGGKMPVYKVEPGGLTTLTFTWAGDGEDLDICGYWGGAGDLMVGYHWKEEGGVYTSDPYSINWSGDVTDSGGSEWLEIKMNPWNGVATTPDDRKFFVHFNFFTKAPDPCECKVIVSQAGGETYVIDAQRCNDRTTGDEKWAKLSDPYCEISFDSTGHLIVP